MPTIFRQGPFRFYFYSHEPNEPPHVHVDRDEATAKFWLHDCSLARSSGFSAKEISVLRSIVVEHRVEFAGAWNAFFGTS